MNIVRWIAYSRPSENVYAGLRGVEMSNDSYRNSVRRYNAYMAGDVTHLRTGGLCRRKNMSRAFIIAVPHARRRIISA